MTVNAHGLRTVKSVVVHEKEKIRKVDQEVQERGREVEIGEGVEAGIEEIAVEVEKEEG